MKHRLIQCTVLVGSLLATLACKDKPPAETAPSAAQAPAAAEPKPAAPEPEKPAAAAPAEAATGTAGAPNAKLLDPASATEQAPGTFKVKFATSKGDIVLEVHRDWAPKGADRFYNLVKMGFFDNARFFRAIDGFMVQFGLNGDPAVNAKWREARIDDDPVKESNKRGYATFATSGANSRTTQMFINFNDNRTLDAMGFAPFGKVVEGLDVLDSLYKGYGEGAPMGAGPSQGRIQTEGNEYLTRDFPKLDFIKEAKLL
jgi:peptidyl-prolyl cis-trans isomerase A (cyclophilin A)